VDMRSGTLIGGRYRLVARLDEGGAAQVWRAEDQELRRPVALKILATPAEGGAAFVERFRNEAQIEARLKHPNIVEVYDWGHDVDANYIVMELLEGRSLRQMLLEGHLLWSDALRISVQAAAALVYAHHEGAAHGGLTPNRIVVRRAGGHATLIGFGVWCREADCVTPQPDADTYALGGVMYEMLTGVSPFGPAPDAFPAGEQWPARPSRLVPGVPAAFDEVVVKAIAPDPSQRYRTADDLLADLTALSRPRRRSPWIWLAPLLIALVALAAIAFALANQTGRVPDVVGRGSTDASATLVSAGFHMVVVGRSPATTVAPDAVVSQSPAPGTQARKGMEVDVVLSAGKPMVAVPSVTGLDLPSASGRITAVGLTVGMVTQQSSATFPAGTVVSERPSAGTEVTVGATVDLVISSGQASLTVPDVRGSSQADATSLLLSAGLKVAVAKVFSTQPAGTVISESPAPGSSVPSSSTVTLSVSKGPAPVVVPNVLGAAEGDATGSLISIGLVPVSVSASGTAGETTGTVIAEDPPGGTSVAPGSRVTITIKR
jgi:eukaryotic-like serine/threonine-protein kinase